MKKTTSAIQLAHRTWLAGADFRSRRARYMRFAFGDQWSDVVRDRNGNFVTERQMAVSSGSKPRTNNLIRPLIKSIVGRYRTEHAGDYDTAVARENLLAELDGRCFEEFLISGCAVQHVEDGRVENVNPVDFFVNAYSDPRGRDISVVGRLLELSLPEVISRFGDGSRERATRLAEIYRGDTVGVDYEERSLGRGVSEVYTDFFMARQGKCRVVELWTLDASVGDEAAGDEAADAPIDLNMHWHCRFLSPGGTVLGERVAESHPFAVKLYPLTDGAVHPFVEDIIEQQRSINRMVTLIDRMLSTSAKGVLLFPVSQMVPGQTWDDIATRWASADGIIPISGKGDSPSQVNNQQFHAGVSSLLGMQMQLFRDISGVSTAMLGMDAGSHVGSEMYQAQVSNAVVSLADIFDSFSLFVEFRNRMLER